MFRHSWRLAQAAEYISRHEFLDALADVCPAAATSRHNGGLPLALAVSGGVDSMALALMCREYMPENGTTLHALVIDHGLRDSSSEEARRVRRVLTQRLKISTQILPLKLYESSMTRTNIETSARKMRYQALGRACKSLSSNNLLVGHHSDDQAETVLMRLVDGHTSMLSGIGKVASIPECYGMHGISKSGSYLPLIPSELPHSCGVTGIEQGGVHLVRPLLDFSKSRLVATCQKYGLSWFEDETNKDKTLTARNAVRHIFEKHRLPEALGREALVRLSRSTQQGIDRIEELVDDLFNQMPLTLELRSSIVTVQFPELNFKSISEALLPGPPNFDLAHKVAQMLIRRVARLVGPLEQASLGSFHHAVGPIFGNSSMSSFQVSGVHFERLGKPNQGRLSTEWRLSRASPPRGERQLSEAGPQSSLVSRCISPTFEPQSGQEEAFELWDNRFWFHVSSPSKHDLWIRPLDVESITSLRSLLAEGKVVLRSTLGNQTIIRGGVKDLDNVLREVAPGKVRWSLPVILSYTKLTTGSTTTGKSQLSTPQILAFPTLGLRVEAREDGIWPSWVKDLKWEVRYKKIKLGTKRLEDCLVGYGRKT